MKKQRFTEEQIACSGCACAIWQRLAEDSDTVACM